MKIIISGGGLIAWLHAYLIIKHTKHEVTIIRPDKPQSMMQVALTPELYHWLTDTTTLQLKEVGDFKEMQIHGSSQRLTLRHDDYRAIAHLVALDDLGSQLEEKVKSFGRINVVDGKINYVDKKYIRTEQSLIDYDILIVAEGTRSSTAVLAGWPKNDQASSFYDFGHHATSTIVKTSKPHKGVSHQYFTDKGIFAYLPMYDPYQSIFITHHVTSKANGPLPFGKQTALNSATSIPLTCCMMTPSYQDNITLVGDCRMRVHPLAGLGLNAGLYCAMMFQKQLKTSTDIDRFWLKEHAMTTQQTINKVFITTKTIGQLSLNELGRFALDFGLVLAESLNLSSWMIDEARLTGDMKKHA